MWKKDLSEKRSISAMTVDDEKSVIAQDNGTIWVIYHDGSSLKSCKIDGEPVEAALFGQSVYLSSRPFHKEIKDDNSESQEVLVNNMLAAKKTGSTLWKLDIDEQVFSIITKREHCGGFYIDEKYIYATNSEHYGFFLLSHDLTEIESVNVKIEPSNRRPWFSKIIKSGNYIVLVQEENRMRLFEQGDTVIEIGIIEPDNPHVTSFLNVNTTPERIYAIENKVIIILDSNKAIVFSLFDKKAKIYAESKQAFSLMLRNVFTLVNNLSAVTEKFTLSIDKYRVAIARADLSELLYAYSYVEVNGETLYMNRAVASGNISLTSVWTHSGKRTIIVSDLSNPVEPKVLGVINGGEPVDAIEIEEDE